MRILITDAQELAGLGAIRSLGQAGYTVTAGHVAGVHPAAKHSRWCHDAIAYPNPWTSHGEFRTWLLHMIASNRYDAVLPIAEAAIAATAQLRSEFPKSVLPILPSDANLQYTLSKYYATHAAIDAGIPVAPTVFVHDGKPGALWNNDLSKLRFPIIIKTDNVLLNNETYRKGKTVVVSTETEAADVLAAYRTDGCAVIAQEFVSGYGEGVSILQWNRKPQLQFMHRRLHEIPWTGGASSLRESIHDPLLKKYTQTLLQTIGYEGVAMVEFRRGYLDSIPYFLEINGRLWGSIALCLHAGIDIPAALIDCVLTGTVCPERRQHSYSDGLRCRNVYPGEVRYLRSIFRATAQTNFPSPPSFASSLFEFFLLFLHPLVRYDVFWFRDPRPAFWQAVVAFADLRAGLLYNARKFFRKYINARSASPKWQKLPALTKPPRALLFVCFGNICRSPFAEKAWNAFAEKNGSSIRATSAGLYPHSGRISPPALAPLIRSLGFDLTSHRSQEITSAMIETADVICVMDMENWHSLLHSFPHAKMKTILLGAFSGDSDPQIPDPFAMPAHRARAVYEKILRSVDGLFTALRSLA